MTDYADIQCDEMTCKTWPKSWQRFTLSFLARDTNGTRVWVGKNRLLFTLDSSTLARISSFHILSLLIIYSNWLWANFNLEKFISWCLKINGWFFRQKTTRLLKIAIYLMTLIRETKKISLFWKKKYRNASLSSLLQLWNFFTPLSSSWVIFSRSRRRARDIKYELLHNALRQNSDQKVQFQM